MVRSTIGSSAAVSFERNASRYAATTSAIGQPPRSFHRSHASAATSANRLISNSGRADAHSTATVGAFGVSTNANAASHAARSDTSRRPTRYAAMQMAM